MHADGGTGSAKMAESERELLSAKPVGSLPPPVMRAVRKNATFSFFGNMKMGLSSRSSRTDLARKLGYPRMSFISGVMF